MNQKDSDKELNNALFFSLLAMLQGTAMQAMGKIVNPITQKVERNLEQSKLFIDMLVMLQEKTKSNLSDEESEYLDHILYELRMNFVEESKKGDDESSTDESEKPETETKPSESEEENNKKSDSEAKATGKK